MSASRSATRTLRHWGAMPIGITLIALNSALCLAMLVKSSSLTTEWLVLLVGYLVAFPILMCLLYLRPRVEVSPDRLTVVNATRRSTSVATADVVAIESGSLLGGRRPYLVLRSGDKVELDPISTSTDDRLVRPPGRRLSDQLALLRDACGLDQDDESRIGL